MSEKVKFISRGFVLLAAMIVCSHPRMALSQGYDFSWDRATVYYVVTEQFLNADPSNDSVGHRIETEPTQSSISGTSGGDFAGLAAKIEDGYFKGLGIDVLCVSKPHLLLSKDSGVPTGFSKTWAFDYTRIDPKLGSHLEWHQLVNRAHANGIRILVDIELPASRETIRWDSTSAGEGRDLTTLLSEAWGDSLAQSEIRSLKEFFERTGYPLAPEYVTVKWLSDWIQRVGIDGYRVLKADSADPDVLTALNSEGQRARRAWNASNKSQSSGMSDIWLVGDVVGHGSERTEFHDTGLDAVTNYGYTGRELDIDSTFVQYSTNIISDPTYNVWSFVPTDDLSFSDRARLVEAGTHLLLLPGVVQINYGDEIGMRTLAPAGGSDAKAAIPMNWDDQDESIRNHWSVIGQFRKNHPAVAGGVHEKLSEEPYAFYRGLQVGRTLDEVVVVLGAEKKVRLNVSRFFPDDTIFRDALTGKISMVSFGEITFQPGASGILLLETVR